MGLDSYAAIPTVENGKRLLSCDLPGRVVSVKSYTGYDGKPQVEVRRVADGFEKVPEMIGGMCSGTGSDGSFRGKAYYDLVEQLTGFSLFEEELPPPVVQKMALMLRASVNGQQGPPSAWCQDQRTADDVEALACFFEACSKMGYSVISWY